MDGSPVGFASLEGPERVDMLYVHPAAAGHGVGSHADRRAGEARGLARRAAADRRCQRQRARISSSAAGFVPQQRNTVPLGDEWLANTTMEKKLAAKERTP